MKVPAENNIPYELIAKYLSGEADPAEIRQAEAWKDFSVENGEIFVTLEKIWKHTGGISVTDPIDLDREWERFRNEVSGFNKENKKLRSVSFIYRIAAVLVTGLVIMFAAYYGYNSIAYKSLRAENTVLEKKLPDGSTISLNRNSKVKYLRSFEKNRNLKLDGEAFFEVVADPSRPFRVRHGDIQVEVIGTSFSVRAYKKDENIEVVVESGKVAVYEVTRPDDTNILLKGDRLNYNRTSRKTVLQNNADPNYHSWKTGILVFNGAELKDVLVKLEEIYEVHFEVADRAILDCTISVRFDNKDIRYIMETIARTLDLSITVKGNTFKISGEGC